MGGFYHARESMRRSQINREPTFGERGAPFGFYHARESMRRSQINREPTFGERGAPIRRIRYSRF